MSHHVGDAPKDAAAGTANILNALTEQANLLLGSVVHTPLEPLDVGGSGQFPYYYQMPSTLQFNALTYKWIAQSMTPKAEPPKLSGQPFANAWTLAFGAIDYTLSTADQNTLNKATQDSQVQQTAMLQAWQSAFGSLPTPDDGQTVTDKVLFIVANTWATPPTTLQAIQNAPDLSALLNSAPAAGQVIMPTIANFLQALGATVALQNQSSMNRGYLALARKNVQTPTKDNGGLTVSGSSLIEPAFQVTTSLADIVNGLKNTGSKVQLSMDVSAASSSEYRVSINSQAAFTIPIGWFFRLSVSSQASYFYDHIVSSSKKVTVSMEFPGVTLVTMQPTALDLATRQAWYWTQPLVNAIKNGKADVTGFKFSSDTGIDFSADGGFGWPQTLAVSTYPTITIVVQTANYESIAKTIQTSTSVQGTFLGIPLFSGGASTYSHTASTNASDSSVTITMRPPATGMGQTVDQNVAWVLGATANFPGTQAAATAPRYQAALRARMPHAAHAH